MFKNVGKTIKVLSLILMILDLIMSVALAALCFLSGKNVYVAGAEESFFGFVGGSGGAILSLIVGFCGLIALLCLYGYGQQIENIMLIRESFEDDDEYKEDDDDERLDEDDYYADDYEEDDTDDDDDDEY